MFLGREGNSSDEMGLCCDNVKPENYNWSVVLVLDLVLVLKSYVCLLTDGRPLTDWLTDGHIVADTLLPMMFLGLRKLRNTCCKHKMFLNKIRNIFCVPDTKFVSSTNVARAGKQGNICVGNNVSATLCPRLPGPLDHTKLQIYAM